jgi:CBS domain containing-hemolysin-like protein
VLRLLGIERARTSEHAAGPEELTFIVEESQEEGLLHGETGDVLRRLLAFSDRTAGEVMVPRVRIHGLRAGSTADAVRRAVRETQHRRYPVYEVDLDHVVGVVHIKGLVPCLAQRRSLMASDVRPVPFVPETLAVGDVLATMRRERTQLAIVMDEHGGTAGLVTIDDLFEEVVGIVQETAEERPFERLADGLAVKGTVRLDELGEELGIALEHEEVDTVSGLVLSLLGRPPEPGDVVEYDHVRFEVTHVDGHGVGACRVVGASDDGAAQPSEL